MIHLHIPRNFPHGSNDRNCIVFIEFHVYLVSLQGSNFCVLLPYGVFQTIKTSLCNQRATGLNSPIEWIPIYKHTPFFFLVQNVNGQNVRVQKLKMNTQIVRYAFEILIGSYKSWNLV